jgi:hypothetical protein
MSQDKVERAMNILLKKSSHLTMTIGEEIEYAKVKFQNGPIKEFGVNGIHQEDLLVIVLDRLQSFQAGEFNCRENALAITKIEEALHWLRHRTDDRNKQGVEGTNKHRGDK